MAQVSVGTSATKVVDVFGSAGPTVQTVLLQNQGSEDVAFSRRSSVAATGSDQGFVLTPGAGMSFDARSDVYAVAASGTQALVVEVL